MLKLKISIEAIILLHEIGEYTLEQTNALIEYYILIYMIRNKNFNNIKEIKAILHNRGYNLNI